MTHIRARDAVVALSVLSSTLLGLAGCGLENDGSDAGTVRVATIPGISSLPVQVALEEGFFEDHGLEVQLTGGLDVAAWQSAVGKQFEIVLSNASSYTQSVSKGLENELINNMVDATTDFSLNSLAAREPIGELDELRGATIGVPTLTGLPTQMLTYQLRQAGLESSDYELVAMPYSAQADNLRAGNVDAVLTAKPYEVGLAEAGFWVSPDDICVEVLADVTRGEVDTCSSVMFVADSAWAEEHSADVDAWLAGLTDAIEFIEAHPDEAASILQDWVGYSDELADVVELPNYALPVPESQLEPVWEVLVANHAVSGAYPSDAIRTWRG